MFDTEKCCVEIEFKACFRDFLRYSLYSSCGRDKLSEAGEFYLRGCKVSALLFCASAFVVSRVIVNSAWHSALWSRYAHHPAFAVCCRYRYRARRVCAATLRAWAIRALLCMPHKAPSFEILREA